MGQVADDRRFALSGPVVMENLIGLYKAGLQKVAEGDVVVDMAGVTDADSSAVSLLLELRREAARRSHKVLVINVPDSVRSLAKLYGVADLLPASA